MSKNKKNLFGYGAYDRDPSGNAYVFSSYSESIDLLARVFTKYYLNPKGTPIYNGETASGSHYNGANVTGVNKHYATDSNWKMLYINGWSTYIIKCNTIVIIDKNNREIALIKLLHGFTYACRFLTNFVKNGIISTS